MNRRRATRALLAAPLAIGAMSRAFAQQPGRVYRIGYLSQPTRASVEKGLGTFLNRLRDLGWVEGKNLVIEYRWADGNADKLPALAADLVRSDVDLIVAPAGSAALAAKNATSRIPIVMMFAADPVALGLIATPNRPGGNVTGTTMTSSAEIFRKQLQILREAVPKATRIAMLSNPVDPSGRVQERESESAAHALGLELQTVVASGPADFSGAFATMKRDGAQALLLGGSSTYLAHGRTIAQLAIDGRLPTISSFREMVEAGTLCSYGVIMANFAGHAAVYVDRILKGAKPADLPVEHPTTFEFVINLKTANAIGLTIPESLRYRADDVIQ